MEGITVKIGERTIPLRFKMVEFRAIEEETGTMMDVKEKILTGEKRIRDIMAMIRIMGNGGLKAAGEKPDLTDEWLGENMDPHNLMAYQSALLAALSKESESEAAKEESENHERDLVLEEISKKKDPANSHTGGSSTGD